MSTKTGFIGLGRMGGAMAQRLLDAGHELVVHDPSPAALRPFAECGAVIATSPVAVADLAQVVIACLPTVAACQTVACGDDGVVHGRAVQVYVEASTIGRPALAGIAGRLEAQGIAVVDAPVSGGPSGALAGTLSVMLAGTAPALQMALPCLDAMCGRQFVVGDVPGQGQVCKLINNALSLVGMALACEATVVGARAGLDPVRMLEVINASTGRNGATLDKFPKAVLTRSFDYGGPLGAATKDLHLFLDEAAGYTIPTPVTSAGAALWDMACGEGDPNRDFTTLIQMVERWAGVEVSGAGARDRSGAGNV